ncbi:hypothetical protein R6Q57_021713 [Mikania cordata]
MGAMKLMILLLLIIFSFTFPVSFSQLDKHSALTFVAAKPPILHESDGSVSGVNNGAMNQSKFAGAGARGGGGHSAGESSSGLGGQPQRGGGAVIPVYAAGSGAAAKNNNHRSTASVCIKCQKDTLLIIGLTSFLLYLSK